MDIQNYKGIKVTVKEEDLTTGVIGLVTPVTDDIVKDQYYTLQFKIINFNTNNALDYLVLTNGENEQMLGSVECSGFQTVGLLKEYLDDEFGYEEKLCFIRFKAEFSSNNARIGIARRMTELDKPDDTAFLIREVSLCRGMVLVPWEEMPDDIKTSIEKIQSEIKQTSKGLSFAVTSVEQGVAENKASIDVMDKEVKIAVQSSNQAKGEAHTAMGEVQVLAGQINSKVSQDEVMSMIEQNPTDVKYYFNRISPSVTINQDGLIVHNGSVACDALTTPSGHNPIIKLFQNGDSYCSIDATKYNEGGGRGSWLRMKWDRSNYWYVGKNAAGVYLDNPKDETNGEYDSQFWVSTTHTRFRANKVMIGRDDCRIDTTGGIIRLYTTPDGVEDRGLVIKPGSGRLTIQDDAVYFTKLKSNGTVESHYPLLTGGGASSVNWRDINEKPSTFPPSSHSHNNYYAWGHNAEFSSCMPTGNNVSGQYCGTTSQAWNYVCCYNLRYNNFGTNVSGYSSMETRALRAVGSASEENEEVKNFFKNYTELSQEIPNIPKKRVRRSLSFAAFDNFSMEENTEENINRPPKDPVEYQYNNVFVMNENGESFVDGAKLALYQSKCLEVLVNELETEKEANRNLEERVKKLEELVQSLVK